MSLENVLTALRYSMSNNLSELDEELLQDNEVKESLTTFFAEQEARPELISLTTVPRLMHNYLSLSLEAKEILDWLRQQNEAYISGEIGVNSPKGSVIYNAADRNKEKNKIIGLYHNINTSNILQKIIDSYIKLKPQSEQGLVFLSSFLLWHDVSTGEKVVEKNKRGNYKRTKTPKGGKIYRRYNEVDSDISFEEWVESMIPKDLFVKLNKLPFYKKETITLAEVVKSYIKHQPESKYGYVPLKGFFQYYQINTGKKLIHINKGKRFRESNPEGSKFYNRYSIEARKKEITFEEWLKTRIPERLFKELMEAPFYKQKTLSLEEAVQSYIEVQPSSQKGSVSLVNFFHRYDLKTGTLKSHESKGESQSGARFISQYKAEIKNSNISFKNWIKTKISRRIYDQLMQTPYYTKRDVTLKEAVNSYVTHQPRSKVGHVSFNNYLRFYDLRTGKQAEGIKNGAMKKWGETQGEKLRHQYQTSRAGYRKNTTKDISMVDWLKDKIPEDLHKKFIETPFYKQEKLNLRKVVEAYIAFQPTTQKGPVSFANFLVCYDLDTGERLLLESYGDRKLKKQPQGKRIYQQFFKAKSKQNCTIEAWTKINISEQLYDRLLKTTYYQQRRPST